MKYRIKKQLCEAETRRHGEKDKELCRYEEESQKMSKRNENDPVSEKLCESRRQTIREEINGLRKTIYAVGVMTTTVIVVVQFLLSFYKG